MITRKVVIFILLLMQLTINCFIFNFVYCICLQIYKEWVNSILCECGLQIQSISQLNTHNLLLKLYELLTNYQVNRIFLYWRMHAKSQSILACPEVKSEINLFANFTFGNNENVSYINIEMCKSFKMSGCIWYDQNISVVFST